ncbi:hypothetical protein SELMODRAFT_420447 [Selaginella moellendorffii]|uniref:Uncharacterized protein n=1 Tax=Selaginella moellendorffii TaxID=88036 RepID=D8SC07_SELML|nr:hypothetical protein SELMODRAFT_420447 [Selaginella moellendorffii]
MAWLLSSKIKHQSFLAQVVSEFELDKLSTRKSCLPPDDIQALDEVDDQVIHINEVWYRTGSARSSLASAIRGAMLADTPGFRDKYGHRARDLQIASIYRNRTVVGGDWERYPYYVSLWNEVHKREEHVFGTKQENDMRYKLLLFRAEYAHDQWRTRPHQHQRAQVEAILCCISKIAKLLFFQGRALSELIASMDVSHGETRTSQLMHQGRSLSKLTFSVPLWSYARGNDCMREEHLEL